MQKRVRVATASGYQDKEVPKKIHISNIAHLRGAVGQEVPSRVRFLEVKDRSGQAQTQKVRLRAHQVVRDTLNGLAEYRQLVWKQPLHSYTLHANMSAQPQLAMLCRSGSM